ncbi:MAG TPA: ATP phosphoribosyltransferase regulatory subunit [Blastocatellia bacterium]|nr:ATP phosphoribosyltransferase regulatory subunit [Blastocatellia bacterium]
MSSLTKIPAGVQYFFDDEVKLRRYVERRAMEVFAGWSYDEIILPMFDYHDLFARGMGEEKAERTYRFVDRDGALLALRPELTTLVARTVATRFIKRDRPIRLCYSGEVFRYDEPTERAAREFHQFGVEYIGEPDIIADIEVLLVAAEALAALGLDGFRIALSHVDFFNGVAGSLKLDGDRRSQLREMIDRRNSLAVEEFLQKQAAEIEESRRADFSRLIQVAGKQDVIRRAREILNSERALAAVDHLDKIYTTLDSLGLGENFDLDLGDTGGLEYYTGLTFKVYAPGCGAAIGGGGRYDNLIANFGEPEPAVGFSIALDGLVGAIAVNDDKLQWRSAGEIQTISFAGDGDSPARAFEQARRMRAQGNRVKISAK